MWLFGVFSGRHLLLILKVRAKGLSLCFHFFCPSTTHPLPYFLFPEGHLCLHVSGVSLYRATCYQPSCFISLFLLSLKWLRENRASWSLTVCGARQQRHILLGSWFSRFIENTCLECRDCKLAAGIWPTGEWFGSRVMNDLGWKESVLGKKAQMLWFRLQHHLSLVLLASVAVTRLFTSHPEGGQV